MTPIANNKCTKSDYRQLFAESAEPLRWLCVTLTGDEALSEQILDAALHQCLKGAEQVFREWMVSWARRLIVKVCIETVRPWTSKPAQEFYPLPSMRLDFNKDTQPDLELTQPSELLQQKLLGLDPLSRFVLVLRGIEGYSRRETSLFLNIDDRACEWICLWAAEALRSNGEQSEQRQKLDWSFQMNRSPLQASA
jgi:DNA-directed RNA polymerase specialized sigma24 family protein